MRFVHPVRRRARLSGPRLTRYGLAAAAAIIAAIGLVVAWQLQGQPSETVRRPASLRTAPLFVDPHTHAARQADAWRAGQPSKAAAMDRLAALPTAKWLTAPESLDQLPAYLQRVRTAQTVPVLVVYALPLRDCGRYSAGGVQNADAYRRFIDTLAGMLTETAAAVILEPDALAGVYNLNPQGKSCLSTKQQAMYFTLLTYATERLAARGAFVYIDAGNSAWVQDTADMADRLRYAGIASADGFSLNVSNFQPTEDAIRYGTALSQHLGGKHFVIDTSRNGAGAYANPTYPEYTWCNPPGRALGHYPTTATKHPLVDAYLYIKYPGESDGQDGDPHKCFGGPAAGTWWPEYAAGLLNRWPESLQP